MRSFIVSALCVAALVHVASAVAQDAQTPIFRAGSRVVSVITTVTEQDGRLVPGLEKEDFSILDNGKPVDLSIFQSAVEPFTAVVMLDKSGSMTANLDLLNQATEQFLLRMLPKDRGQVGSFSDKIQLSGSFTSNRDELVAALRDLQFGNPTRLYDAIDVSLNALKDAEGRKVVLIFTDGEDTSSRLGFGEVLDRAKKENVMVYAIGLQSEFFNGQRVTRSRPDRALRKLAEETGGGYFELSKTTELTSTFTRVAQELHSQYILGFAPPALDGKEHKLTVKMRAPGMTARARKSYIADADRLD